MGRFSMASAVAIAAVSAVLAGCRDAGAVALRKQARDVVSFETGGDGPSLAELLRRSGPAPRGLSQVGAPPAELFDDTPARKWREIRLAPGQTLSQLCAAELGSAARWREVAALNGWSEAAVSSLPRNQVVKLPPD